jgi:hypothetical protein
MCEPSEQAHLAASVVIMDLADQLPQLQHVRQPPVPVVVSRLLDEGRSYPGLLYGWQTCLSGPAGCAG